MPPKKEVDIPTSVLLASTPNIISLACLLITLPPSEVTDVLGFIITDPLLMCTENEKVECLTIIPCYTSDGLKKLFAFPPKENFRCDGSLEIPERLTRRRDTVGVSLLSQRLPKKANKR